jgi:hypothetical protein
MTKPGTTAEPPNKRLPSARRDRPHVPLPWRPAFFSLLGRARKDLFETYSIEQLPAWSAAQWSKDPDALNVDLDRAPVRTAQQIAAVTQAKILLLFLYKNLWTIKRAALLKQLTRGALRHKVGGMRAREHNHKRIEARNLELNQCAEDLLKKHPDWSAEAVAVELDKDRWRKHFKVRRLLAPPKKSGSISKIIAPTVKKFKTNTAHSKSVGKWNKVRNEG